VPVQKGFQKMQAVAACVCKEEEKNIIKCGPKPECLIEGRIRIQKAAGCCWGIYTIAHTGVGSSATQLLCGLAFLLIFFFVHLIFAPGVSGTVGPV